MAQIIKNIIRDYRRHYFTGDTIFESGRRIEKFWLRRIKKLLLWLQEHQGDYGCNADDCIEELLGEILDYAV